MAGQRITKHFFDASSDDESQKHDEDEQSPHPHSDEVDEESDEYEESKEEEKDEPPLAQPLSKNESIEGFVSECPADDTQQVPKVSKGKKTKIGNGDHDVEDVKFGLGKLWLENDEIALLQGMIDFKSKTGADPCLNLSQFYVSADGLLSVHGSKTRLSEKIRRLKKKYKINVENGNHNVLSQPHELKLFELSNKIWSHEGVVNVGKVNNSTTKDDSFTNNSNEEGTTADILSLFPQLFKAIELEASTYLCVPKDTKEYAKKIISSLGKEKARELEEEWQDIRVMEYELCAKRAEVIFKQTQAIVDVVKSQF